MEYVDVMRNAGQEYFRALRNGNGNDAREVVQHLSEMYGLPTTAAESMIDQFRRQSGF